MVHYTFTTITLISTLGNIPFIVGHALPVYRCHIQIMNSYK